MRKSKFSYRDLTDRLIAQAKPEVSIYYLPDRGRGFVAGLRICVRPSNSKLWVMRYRLPVQDGAGNVVMRESTAGLGSYPATSLAEAREKARTARQTVATGTRPAVARKVRAAQVAEAHGHTFGAVAARWLAQGAKQGFGNDARPWSAHHVERNSGLLRRYLLPTLAAIPVGAITEGMVEAPIREAYESGRAESARRAAVIARQVMDYAKARRWIAANPLSGIMKNPDLAKPKVTSFAALPKGDVGAMLRALDASESEPVTRVAIYLLLHTGLREAALRAAQWRELDLDAGLWTVPASRMKSRREHVLPLPAQAVALLKDLATTTDRGPESYIFASRGKAGYLAENTLRLRLHGLGYKVTAHGMRSLITDLLNEQGFNPDAIERQLDHVLPGVRKVYLRSDFLEQRRRMVQWLADWCEAQRDSTAASADSNVVPMRA